MVDMTYHNMVDTYQNDTLNIKFYKVYAYYIYV